MGDLHEMRGQDLWKSRGGIFQEEDIASINTPSWDYALCIHWNNKETTEAGEGWGESVVGNELREVRIRGRDRCV